MVKHKIFFAAAICILVLFTGCNSNKQENITQGNITITRTLPSTVHAGENFTVSLSMTVNGSPLAVGLEDDYPSGWTVSNISLKGKAKSNPDRIEWLFWPLGEPVTNTTINYTITVPQKYSGTAVFKGSVITKTTSSITGDTSVNVINY